MKHDDDILIHPCPACGDAYGEHTLVSLAECIEALLCDADYTEEFIPLRPVETIRTELL